MKWTKACDTLGFDGLHFHDLRHVAGTLAASTGVGTKKLMHRLGHASPRAALLYQHATVERDKTIANAMSDLIRRSRTEGPRQSSVPIDRGADKTEPYTPMKDDAAQRTRPSG